MCVCVCVCVCVCESMSFCVSVQAITFEAVDIKTSFLVWWYMMTVSRSFEYQGHWFMVKAISWKRLIWLHGHHFNFFNLSEVKVIKEVKVTPRSNCKHSTFYWQAGGEPLTDRYSCFYISQFKNIILFHKAGKEQK